MKTPEYLPLLIAPPKRLAGTGWASNIVALGFIALMASLAAPPEEAPSAYDKPIPMPAGIEEAHGAWLPPVPATTPQ